MCRAILIIVMILPTYFDHPVIQPTIGIPHHVIQNDQLFQFLSEVLLQCFGPLEPWTRVLRRITALGSLILRFEILSCGTRKAIRRPIVLPRGSVCVEGWIISIWPWVFPQKQIRISRSAH
jgi:hypothetical protein